MHCIGVLPETESFSCCLPALGFSTVILQKQLLIVRAYTISNKVSSAGCHEEFIGRKPKTAVFIRIYKCTLL